MPFVSLTQADCGVHTAHQVRACSCFQVGVYALDLGTQHVGVEDLTVQFPWGEWGWPACQGGQKLP